jgi:XTP/dITP diphosphohydrolase
MKILLATTNPGKLTELKKGLTGLVEQGIELVELARAKPCQGLALDGEPEETGATFAENALIKAKFYADHYNLPAIGDDGGLMIDALNDEPGVKSRRWPGYSASDDELIALCLQKMVDLKGRERQARLNVHLCYFNSLTGKQIDVYQDIKGQIALAPSKRRITGYPFRSLFIVEQFNKYYDELTAEEHQQINHRLKAAQKMARGISKLLKFKIQRHLPRRQAGK